MAGLFQDVELPRFGSQSQWNKWIASQLERCDDEAFARRFESSCPVEGATWQAYQHRIVECGNARLLCGIRFKGSDRDLPFVDLLAWDGCLSPDWMDCLQSSFEQFRPIGVRYSTPSSTADSTTMNERLGEVDQYVVAGPAIGKMHHSVRPASDLSWFAEFQDEFAQWQKTAEHGHEVTAATKQELEECLANGHVVVAYENNRFVGMAACQQCSERAISGWCMIEEFVRSAQQGRGHGTALQQALMAQTPAGSLLWGTIHGTNGSSLAVAKKCGRQAIETWLFVPFDSRSARR